MKIKLAIFLFLLAPAAFAGVAQDYFLAATKNANRVMIRNLEANMVIADSEVSEFIAKARGAVELVDPPANEPTWKLPSFCCAKYSISFRRPDGTFIEYVVKHEITAILAPDAHGLHDLTDIPLSANSQKALRALLTEAVVAKEEPPVWLQNGKPVANSDDRKSVDGFGVALVITSDSNWEEKWETPADTTPSFTTVDTLMLGERAWVLIFFTNPRLDDRQQVVVECDIKITRPNGQVTEDKNRSALKGPFHGVTTNTFMADPVIGFVGEASDPLGDWIFEIVVHDRIHKVSVPVKAKFTLVEKSAKADAKP